MRSVAAARRAASSGGETLRYPPRTGLGATTKLREVAKSFAIDNVAPMHPVQTSFRILTWCCVLLLAVLSLLPAQDMVRTGFPGQLEHSAAYAGSAIIAVARVSAARSSTHHRLILGVRRSPGVLTAFFAGPTSRNRGFCGIGVRSVRRRARCSPPRTLLVETRIFRRRLI